MYKYISRKGTLCTKTKQQQISWWYVTIFTYVVSYHHRTSTARIFTSVALERNTYTPLCKKKRGVLLEGYSTTDGPRHNSKYLLIIQAHSVDILLLPAI